VTADTISTFDRAPFLVISEVTPTPGSAARRQPRRLDAERHDAFRPSPVRTVYTMRIVDDARSLETFINCAARAQVS
jgi:hypothetical protein